jgi:hypothetical protein
LPYRVPKHAYAGMMATSIVDVTSVSAKFMPLVFNRTMRGIVAPGKFARWAERVRPTQKNRL